jgi:hypothetical protein
MELRQMKQRMRLTRAVLLCGLLSVLCLVIHSAGAQTKAANSAPPKTTHRIDPRYAIARGSWSAAAISLFNTWTAFDQTSGRHISFSSPDGKKRIEVVGANVYLWVGGKEFETDINSVSKHDGELSWAPDSTKYFVTWTESGELGPWHMQVYGVDETGAHEFPKVEEPARKDFERRVRQWPIDPDLNSPELRTFWNGAQYCEPYHVIGGRWMNGSKEILLSVLIPNVGTCRYMSEFNVYRVNSTTGAVLQRFTAKAAHRQFGGKYLPIITR